MDNPAFAVAIDGPSGAGKSSVARQVAQNMGMTYIDTGAMYRAVGLCVLRAGGDIRDPQAVADALPGIGITLTHRDGVQRVLVNGEDVTEALRTQEAAEGASAVAAYPPVRAHLLDLQRQLAQNRGLGVVMDGRDIGSHVLPWAQVKIYLDASQEERVKRRAQELGRDCDPARIAREIAQRDERDMNRAAAPLVRAADAVYIDSSGMSLEEATEAVAAVIAAARRVSG